MAMSDVVFLPDGGLPSRGCHFERPAESQTDSQQGDLWQLCRCPSLNNVRGLVSLSAAGIGFVINATEADALSPLPCIIIGAIQLIGRK
jgi:hypothetical protein